MASRVSFSFVFKYGDIRSDLVLDWWVTWLDSFLSRAEVAKLLLDSSLWDDIIARVVSASEAHEENLQRILVKAVSKFLEH